MKSMKPCTHIVTVITPTKLLTGFTPNNNA